MHVRRSLRNERGGVLALSAILIPIFIVLVALAYDVGTWYTHKRQLQNRADAGALAAGVEYTTRWAACGGTATQKAQAETLIDAAARTYAGDPGSAGTLHNTEVTEQLRVNVEINSPSRPVDPDTSWNDPGINGLGPCDPHTVGDRFTVIPAGESRYWVDVGVRERDQRSLFGMFGVDLLRNTAHARVQLAPLAAGKGFLPIAVPEQQIEQAQIRYYNYCNPNNPTFMQKATLRPLHSDYQNPAGPTYWAPTFNNDQPTGIVLTMPDDSDCGGDGGEYIPIVAEVRLAGVKPSVVNIDTSTCAELVAARFADCWTGLSNIRVFKDTPSTEPWFQEAAVGGGTCGPDGYFAVTTPATSCTYSASAAIDFNDIGGGSVATDDVDVSIDGVPASYSGSTFPDGLWTMDTDATNSVSGRSNVTVSWCIHPGPGNCKTGGANQDPHGTKIVHAMYRNNNIAPILELVRTSWDVQQPEQPGVPSEPGDPIDWFRAQPSPEPVTVYPTVALESSLYIGQRRTLRLPHCASGNNDTNDCSLDLGAPNDSQSLDCEPATGGQGHDFQMFATGCDPWYGYNDFTPGTWWKPGNSPPPGSCPTKNEILAEPNGPDSPWRCVVKAPGFSPPVIANGIAAAIGNCSNMNSNSCQTYACTNPNFYDPADPDKWALGNLDPEDTPARIVYLFVVPYGAYKNTGPQDALPLLNFVGFYVTGWEGQGNGGPNQNPCLTDPDGDGPARADEPTSGANGGDIVGYFVGATLPGGVGDPSAECLLDALRPCVPVLVR